MPTTNEIWGQFPKDVLERKLRLAAWKKGEHKAALAPFLPQTLADSAWDVLNKYKEWLRKVEQCAHEVWEALGNEVTPDFIIAVLERELLPRLSTTNQELLEYVSWACSDIHDVGSPLDPAAILAEVERLLPWFRQRLEDETTDVAWHESVTWERQESAAPETIEAPPEAPAERRTGTAPVSVRLPDHEKAGDASAEPEKSARRAAGASGVNQERQPKRGPRANMDYHFAIAAVAKPYGDGWREQSNPKNIAAELDRNKARTPPKNEWASRKPHARSWTRAVDNYPELVRKTIAYSLKMVARNLPK